jgi:hypothetical protein
MCSACHRIAGGPHAMRAKREKSYTRQATARLTARCAVGETLLHENSRIEIIDKVLSDAVVCRYFFKVMPERLVRGRANTTRVVR